MNADSEKKAELEMNISATTSGMQEVQKFPSLTSGKQIFNPAAPPFQPPYRKFEEKFPTLEVGPSKVAVNAKIWETIASERTLPTLPMRIQDFPESLQSINVRLNNQMPLFNPIRFLSGCNYPPPYEDDYIRNVVFTRNFGPVANPNGFIELRLRENIRVLISLDRSILVLNPNAKVKIAVSSGNMSSISVDHPNGKIYQQYERVDIITYDGTKKLNNYVRYAKMWEKGVSLTSDGCALIYLVDNAGTRTTSDSVNKNYQVDYSWGVFAENCRLGVQYFNEAEEASKGYHYFTQDDGTQVFDILGFRVSQTVDGMVRVSRSNRLKIHTSPSNGSATLTTPHIHCTASMGQSSHLFVRRDERRMHFDGSSFVVRNAGHSSGFDDQNLLCVY